jgi:acetyltransferase-like isoleucine patch superfamily enzyme
VTALRALLGSAYFMVWHGLRQPLYLLRSCRVAWSSRVGPGCVLVGSQVGAYSYLGGGVLLTATRVGNYCSIAAGAKIGGMEHPWWWGSTSPRLCAQILTERETVIEDDVWIGANAVLRQGVHVGRGAVVGAGAVVLQDVAPYSIVAGVPARVLRQRFEPAVVQQIEATRFWEHPPARARALLGSIPFPQARE